MTVRKILLYSENQNELRQRSEDVSQINRHVKRIVRDLKDTLQASDDGIGLAAPQINIHQRVVVVCLGSEIEGEWKAGSPRALINPRVIFEKDPRKDFDGCLSFPGLYGETIRPHHIQVTAMDEDGNPIEEVFEGFNAVLVHHEIDHLEGVLFIDRVETADDLYTLRKNERGEWMKVPFKIAL